MATATNPQTGIEYYTDGPNEGRSVKLYVSVTNGQVRNPSGSSWPTLSGGVHDFTGVEFYELVPFTPVPFDPELFVVDDATSGWELIPKPGGAPSGHVQGTYRRVESIVRRPVVELKVLARGYYEQANRSLWPQEGGYTEKLAYAREQIGSGNPQQRFQDILDRHNQLIAASFQNDARLAQLYREIDLSGESGPIGNFRVTEGWINGIA